MKKRNVVIVDRELVPYVLKAFGKSVDKEGYIIEIRTNTRIPSKDGSEIRLKEFGGLIKGSEIYLKSDIASLINYVESR